MIILHIKKYRIFYSYLSTLVFMILFVFYIKDHKEVMQLLCKASPKYLIGIILLAVIFKVVAGLKFKIMINFFGIALKRHEWFGLSCVSSMINSFLPAHAGIFAQAIYLKRAYQFEYSKFTSYLANFLVFMLTVSSFSGIMFILLYYVMYHVFYTTIFLILSIVLVLNLAFILCVPYLGKIDMKLELLNKMMNGFQLFRDNKGLLIRMLIVQTADIFITGGRIFLAYLAVGAKVDFLPVLLVGLFASGSVIVSFTPAGLGVRELFITLSSFLIGEGAAFGLAVSLIDRVIGTVVTFISGIIFMHILLPAKKDQKKFITLKEVDQNFNA